MKSLRQEQPEVHQQLGTGRWNGEDLKGRTPWMFPGCSLFRERWNDDKRSRSARDLVLP